MGDESVGVGDQLRAGAIVTIRVHASLEAAMRFAERAERRRIRKALRELRATWYERLCRRRSTKLFEGAARAVQALDEAIGAVALPRRRGR